MSIAEPLTLNVYNIFIVKYIQYLLLILILILIMIMIPLTVILYFVFIQNKTKQQFVALDVSGCILIDFIIPIMIALFVHVNIIS